MNTTPSILSSFMFAHLEWYLLIIIFNIFIKYVNNINL